MFLVCGVTSTSSSYVCTSVCGFVCVYYICWASVSSCVAAGGVAWICDVCAGSGACVFVLDGAYSVEVLDAVSLCVDVCLPVFPELGV